MKSVNFFILVVFVILPHVLAGPAVRILNHPFVSSSSDVTFSPAQSPASLPSTVTSQTLVFAVFATAAAAADGQDTLTSRIIIENTGDTAAFDLQVAVALPSFLTSGTVLSVTRGATSINVPTTGNLFSTGLTLPNVTSLTPSGANIIIITYRATVVATAPAFASAAVTATLSSYALNTGGSNALGASLSASYTATLASPAVVSNSASTEMNASLKRAWGAPVGETLVAVGERVNLTVAIRFPEGQSQNVNIRPTLSAPFGFDITGYVFSTSASPTLSVAGGTFNSGDESFTFTTVTNTPNGATGAGDNLSLTVMMVVNATTRQWVTDAPQTVSLTLTSNGASAPVVWSSPSFRIAQSALRTNFTFNPSIGDGADTVTTTVFIRQPHIACGATTQASLTLTCEVGVISRIVSASYGNPTTTCNPLTNTASITQGSCHAPTSAAAFASCINRPSCTIAAASITPDPCAGVTKTLAAYAECGFPTTPSYNSDVVITVSRQFLNPRTFSASVGGVTGTFNPTTYTWTVSTIPFMAFTDIITVSFVADVNATVETNDRLPDAAPPLYYNNPSLNIQSVGPGAGAFPIRTPSISLIGSTSLIDTVLSGNREYLAPGETGVYRYTVQLWEGSTTNGQFFISTDVRWINITRVNFISLGSQITPNTPLSLTLENRFFSDAANDYVYSFVGNRVMTPGTTSGWQFVVEIEFTTLDVPGVSRFSNGAISAQFTSLLSSTTNRRDITLAEPMVQTKIYCQGVSPVTNGTGTWLEFWPTTDNINGPNFQRRETSSSVEYGTSGPGVFTVDNFSTRMRGCISAPTGAQSRTFRITADDGFRLVLADRRYESWPSSGGAARQFDITIPVGSCVPFWLEHTEASSTAFTRLQWITAGSGATFVAIPTSNLNPISPVHAAEVQLDCEIHVWAISTSPAYGAVFNVSVLHDLTTASLPQGAYVSGSLGAPRAGAATVVQTTGSGGGPAALITTNIISTSSAEVLRIPFRATVVSTVELGRMFNSVASATFRSAPGTVARNYNNIPIPTISTPAVMSPFVNMSIVSTSNDQTGSERYATGNPDIAIGELVTTHTDVEFRPGQASNSRFVFSLPFLSTSPITRFGITQVSVLRVGSSLTVTGDLSQTFSNFLPSVTDGLFDTVSVNLGNVVFPPANWATSTFTSRSIRVAVTFYPSNNGFQFTVNNRVMYPRGDFISQFTSPYATTPFEVVSPVLQASKAVSGPVVAAGRPLQFLTTVSHTSASQSIAFRVNVTDPSTFLSGASSTLAATFSAPRWVVSQMTLPTTWALNWTHVPVSSELECGLSTFPVSTIQWAADPERAALATANSNSPTIATPTATVDSVVFVDSVTRAPISNPTYAFQDSIFALATVRVPAARCSNLQFRLLTPAGRVALVGIEAVTPGSGMTTSLASFDAIRTAITSPASGQYLVGCGNVMYSGPDLSNTMTLLLRLTITDSSCTLTRQNLTISASVRSASAGYSAARDATFTVAAPQTQIGFNDYVVSKCQQWALLQPPVTGSVDTVFASIPQGWIIASNSSDSIDVIREMTPTWSSIVPSGGCILTAHNISGTITVVGFTVTGAPCPGPYVFQRSVNDSSCIGTDASDRILLRGAASSNCDTQQNRFCEPSPPIRLVGQDPSSYVAGTTFPTDYYVFAAPGSASLNLALQVILPARPVLDVLLVLDTNGLTAADVTQLRSGVSSLFSQLTDSAYFNAQVPTVGLVTVSTTGRVPTYSVRSPLTSSASELTTAMGAVTPTGIAASPNGILSALPQIMTDSAAIGWREVAYKIVVVISDNDFFDDASARDASVATNIVTSFYSGNPVAAVANRYTSLAASLPLGRYSAGTVQGSNLGSNRYNGWASNAAPLIKNTYLTITVVPAGDHSDATPFVRTLPAKLDLSGSSSLPYPATYNRNITVGWPAGLDPEIKQNYRVLGQFMGFGAVGVRMQANSRPVAEDVSASGNEDSDVAITLPVSDKDKNKLQIRFLTGPPAVNVRLLTANDQSIVAYNVWYQAVDFIVRPAANYFGSVAYTYQVSDGCATDNSTVSITINNVNDPPVARSFGFNINEDETNALNQRVTFTPWITDIDHATSALTIVILSNPSPALGSLKLTSGADIVVGSVITSQTILFVPASNQFGVCTFTYAARDPTGATSNEATVTVTIAPVNDNPVLTVPTNPVFGRIRGPNPSQDFNAIVSDVDSGDSVSLEVIGLGSGINNLLSHRVSAINPEGNGDLTNTTSLPFTWTSLQPVGPSGGDVNFQLRWLIAILFNDTNAHTFTLRARDSRGATSNSVIVSLRVSENTPPQSEESEIVVLYEDDIRVPVLLSGFESDYGDFLEGIQLVLPRLPSNGRLFASGVSPLSIGATVTAGNITARDEEEFKTTYTIFYTPNPDYNGEDSFTFQFRDRNGALSSPLTQRLVVLPVNDPPTTSGFSVTTFQDTPLTITGFTGSDIDGTDSLYLSILSAPNGDLKNLANDSLVYPANFTAGSTWAVIYNPPTFACNDSGPFTTFDFSICDGTACSSPAQVSITVICVNHAPFGADKTVVARQETPLAITVDVRDDDLFDPPSVLVVQITSIDFGGKAQLFLDAALTTPVTLFASIPFPHRVYFLSDVDVYSTNNEPLGVFQYQVVDPGTLISRPRNTVSVIVERVNKPPRYLGNLDVYTDEDVPINFFFTSASAIFDDGFRLGLNVTGYLLASTHRGSLRVCDANDDCSLVTVSGAATDNFVTLPEPIQLNHRQGRVVFNSEQYTYANNYTALRVGLRDQEGLWANYTIRVHVRPVNNAPVLTPLFPSITDNPTLFEDESYVLRWTVTDVDSNPSSLVTDITVVASNRRLTYSLFACDVSNSTFDVRYCSHNSSEIVGSQAGVGAVPVFLSSSTSCNTVEGLPTTDFTNCFTEFRLLFVPGANLFSYRYTQLLLTARDDRNATSTPVDAVLSVRPVNDAPTIFAPSSLVAAAGSGRVALRGGDVAEDASPPTIGADDIDAPNLVALNLTFVIPDKIGTIDFKETGCTFVDTSSANVYWCNEKLETLNKRLRKAEFVLSSDFIDVGVTASVQITIDDLGWVGEDNLPHLNASTTVQVSYTPPTQIITPPTTSNVLFIASAVSAVVALALLGLLAWRLNKRFQIPADDYFQLGVSAISTAAINPLFKQAGKEGANPLYKGSSPADEAL